MGRHKDANWTIPDSVTTFEQASLAVLMDIRDELKRLNSIIGCPRFISIPKTLDSIKRNTVKKRRIKK